MDSTRRDFLKMLSLTAGSLSVHHGLAAGLSPLLLAAERALAAPLADPKARFVLIRVPGGMDSVLGLHPVLSEMKFEDADLFRGYKPDLQPKTNINGTSISLGPSALALEPFVNNMAVVRGLYMGPNDLGHPFALQYITSGRTQESAPYLTSVIGSGFARNEQKYTVTNTPLQRGTLRPFPTMLTSVLRTHLVKAFDARKTLLDMYNDDSLGVGQFLELLKKTDMMDRFRQVMKDQQPIDNEKYTRAIADGKKSDEAATLAAKGDVADDDVLLASLYCGIARTGQIDLSTDAGGSIDTHAAHDAAHLSNQKSRWDRIAKFLEKLKKYELDQDTLVVVVSEFNRTPGLNINGGKDHNYSDNAVALFGRGVRGGTVVGDRRLYTRADGFPYAYWAGDFVDVGTADSVGSGKIVDVAKGTRAPRGTALLRPHDLWRTVLTSLDSQMIDAMPSKANVIPGIFNRTS